MLTHLSLFSGIGGLDLAAEWAGFTTAGQCEWADYPTKILGKHWPDVPRWRDIRTLTKEDFRARTGLRTVDLISGGFPCQPFSTAGKRRGKDDDRYLWPEMLRVIAELQPDWVVGENVAGIVGMALDQVLSDLEAQGYEARAIMVPACGVNAPHRRYRVAILAHAERAGLQGQHIAPAQQAGAIPQGQPCAAYRPGRTGTEWWDFEPDVGRVADGVPYRVDRLRCLGNAVVPQQFYPIFKAIADLEGIQDE